MSIEERKARLVSIILSSGEEELIDLLEEDVTDYNLRRAKDMTEDLSDGEQEELKEMMREPADKDTVSLEEFRAEMNKWRTVS